VGGHRPRPRVNDPHEPRARIEPPCRRIGALGCTV